jgi:hypothetical protein
MPAENRAKHHHGESPKIVRTTIGLLLTSLVGVTLSTATAQAEDCLAAPNSPAREGTRWYYRLDQVTQHKCWYMRALDQSTQQAASPVKTILPAPTFAIPIPRPRPSTADSALSLNPADTDPFPSHAEEIDAKPSATPPVNGSTGDPTWSIPKESTSQQPGTSLSAILPNAALQTGTATDETDSAISETRQAAPSLETNAAATAEKPSAETPAGATTVTRMDDSVSSTPNDSATKLSTTTDFRSNNAEPAPDVSGAQPDALLPSSTVNARLIPPELGSDGSERTVPSDKSTDNAGTQIRPFYLILAFVVAMVGMLYYLIFLILRYLPGGSARISIDDTEVDWVGDDQYSNPEFYRKLREGPALDNP